MGGSDDAVVAYQDVLAERVRLVVGTVTRIDAAVHDAVQPSTPVASCDAPTGLDSGDPRCLR